MTKSLIKKIFSFNKSKKKELQQVLSQDEADTIKKNQIKKQNTTSINYSEKDILSEPDIKKTKVIITNTVYEKEIADPFVLSPIQKEETAWFKRFKKGLALSSLRLSESISDIFIKKKLDEDTLQELEDILIQADLGVETTTSIIDCLSSKYYNKNLSPDDVQTIVSDEIKKVLDPVAIPLELDLNHKPHVILLVGVNGTGKTTTIGKLAAKLTSKKLKVMLAAGDTFRTAAIEQLHIWGERTESTVISTKLGADSASLAFDAYKKAKKENYDILIIDTAGRLQNKTELMDELAKIVRVLKKHSPKAPHTILQTLDATTGQNALNQVDIFRNIANVNGLVMTKLDGTARGGILVSIAAKYKLPVHFIGIGENIEDLQPFSSSDFAETIAGKHS
ncbi:signal recognition particle-docking protein FtsY [Bartonella sp. B41]